MPEAGHPARPGPVPPDRRTGASSQVRPFDIVFAATRSHLHDLSHVAPALAEVLAPAARCPADHLPQRSCAALAPEPSQCHSPADDGMVALPGLVAENRFHVGDCARARHAVQPGPVDQQAARPCRLWRGRRLQPPAALRPDRGPQPIGPSDVEISLKSGATACSISRSGAKRPPKLASGGQVLSQTLGDIRRVRNFWLRELGLA